LFTESLPRLCSTQATPRNGGHRHFPSDVSEPSFAQAAELARTQNELAKARQRISDLVRLLSDDLLSVFAHGVDWVLVLRPVQSNDFKQYQDRMEEKVRRNAHRQASISPSSATVAALQQKVADLTQRLQEKNKDGLGGSSASGSGGATAQEVRRSSCYCNGKFVCPALILLSLALLSGCVASRKVCYTCEGKTSRAHHHGTENQKVGRECGARSSQHCSSSLSWWPNSAHSLVGNSSWTTLVAGAQDARPPRERINSRIEKFVATMITHISHRTVWTI